MKSDFATFSLSLLHSRPLTGNINRIYFFLSQMPDNSDSRPRAEYGSSSAVEIVHPKYSHLWGALSIENLSIIFDKNRSDDGDDDNNYHVLPS